MKWEEVRKIYPEKYVMLQVLESHVEGDKKYIDDGLIGLDILRDAGVTIDLRNMRITESE